MRIEVKSSANTTIQTMFVLSLLLLSLIISTSVSLAEDSNTRLSLSEVLNSAKAVQAKRSVRSEQADSFMLLASSPKVYVNYLGEGDIQGAETEIGLSLDFMSFAKHGLSDQFEVLEKKIEQVNTQNLDLYLSSLIRNLIWDMALAKEESQQADSKIQWLGEMEQFLVQLRNTGVGSKMALLRVQLELTQLQQTKAKSEMNYQSSLNQYRTLTGLIEWPSQIVEQLSSERVISAAHPQLEKLALAQKLSLLELKSQSSKQEDWNMTLFQKEVDVIGQTDRQLGVSVQIPLSFNDNYQASTYQAWRVASAELDQQYLKAQTELSKQLTDLQQQQRYLLQVNELVAKKLVLTKQLETDLERLKKSQAIGLDEYYKRLIELKDSQFQSALNQLKINRNIALQNQVLGKSL